MAKFLNDLCTRDLDGTFRELIEPLEYRSDVLMTTVIVPKGFIFDNESIPRIPLIYAWLGRTSDRAGCIHDYLYRKDSVPVVKRRIADEVYREANGSRGIGFFSRWCKWAGVRCGGCWSYHKRPVMASYKELTD